MGLDTYAYHGDRNEMLPASLFEHIPPVLMGGMFSGNGNGSSFRGKTYAPFMKTVLGVDLYREKIEQGEVREIADRFHNWIAKNNETIQGGYADLSEGEIRALAEWFSVVAENNGKVLGWW